MFSFLSKDIVIHSISRILGSTNVLHCNAKDIENYFSNCLSTVVVVVVFFFSKARSAILPEMRVRLDGRFHVNSTLLKGSRRAKTDRI